MAGFERGRQLDKIGLDAQDTAPSCRFTSVAVPASLLTARREFGVHLLDAEPARRADAIAIMAARGWDRALEQTLQYAKERKAFVRSIGGFESSRFFADPDGNQGHCGACIMVEFGKLHLAGVAAETGAMARVPPRSRCI